MITEIRKKLKSQGFKIILWITILGMVIVFVPSILKRSGGQSIPAITINGNIVAYHEFERKVYQESERIELFRQQLGQYGEALLKKIGMSDPRVIAIQALMQEAVMNDIARRIGITLSSDFVLQKISDPYFVVEVVSPAILDMQGNINMTMLKRYLQRYNMSMGDFEDFIEGQIKRKLVSDVIHSAAYVTKADIKYQFMNAYLGKKFAIATFSFNEYLSKAKAQPITDEQLKSFFVKENQHKYYWFPEKRAGTLFYFSPENYHVEITDEEIQTYYNSHKQQKFAETPVQVQVRRILVKLDKNADEKKVQEAQERIKKIKEELSKDPNKFESLAREFSDDKLTSKKGGLTEYFKKGDRDVAFEKAAFRLRNDGDISDEVVTNDGLELLQRVGRKAATFKPLSAVRKEIRCILELQKFKNIFVSETQRVIDQAKNNPDIISNFIQQHNGEQKKIDLTLKSEAPIIQKLFKLKEHEWGAIIDDNQGVLIHVTTVQKSHEKEFESIKTQVRQDFYYNQARQKLMHDLEQAKSIAVQEGIDQVKNTFKISIEHTPFLKLNDKEKISELENRHLPMRKLLILEYPGTVMSFETEQGGIIGLLEAYEPFNQEEFNKIKDEQFGSAYQEEKELIQKGFIASLFRNATIKFAESLNTVTEEN